MTITRTAGTNILASSADAFSGFKLKTVISTVFVEHNDHILLLQRCPKEDQPGVWGVPGGKQEGDETPFQILQRELREETQIGVAESSVTYYGHRYARIPGWDYIVHIFHLKLGTRPPVVLDPKEHVAYEWVSMYAFPTLPLLKGQDEVFRIVYGDRMWHRVIESESKASRAAQLVLRKGDRKLIFDRTSRLVFNLIGTSGSGKGTQGDLLSSLFGLPNLSAGDIFRDEFRSSSLLGGMIAAFDKAHFPKYLPDEVPMGMMAKRLSQPDCEVGFTLDGFPRTAVQGDFTREIVLKEGDCHIPIFMDVPESEVRDRLPGREICPDCGFQVRKFPPNPTPGFCPQKIHGVTKVALTRREEDIDAGKIDRRFNMFNVNRNGILASMAKRDEVATFKLTNETPPREVLHLLRGVIEQRLDHFFAEKIKTSLLTSTTSAVINMSQLTSQHAFKAMIISGLFFGVLAGIAAGFSGLKKLRV